MSIFRRRARRAYPVGADGAETWPFDDIMDMTLALYADARRLGVDAPWYVPFMAVNELDDRADDDEDEGRWPAGGARDGAA